MNRTSLSPRCAVAFGVTALAASVAGFSTPALGQAKLLGYWEFNDSSNTNLSQDAVHGLVAAFERGTTYTADQGGHTGLAGDMALRLTGSGIARVSQAIWLNATTANDQLAISFWQKLVAVGSGSSFWFASPTSSDVERGFQAHVPWSGSTALGSGTIYFDTAGCCALGTQRINQAINVWNAEFDWTQWHHFIFLKNGTLKQVYIDGQLFMEGEGANPLPTDFYQFTFGGNHVNANLINGMLDDIAVFGGDLAPEQIDALASGASPRTFDADTDGDGMPDWWEDMYGLNKNSTADAAVDSDADGLTNLAEYRGMTDPNKADTDGDGLKDGAETRTGVWVSATNTGTDPLNPDSDGDTLKDGVETRTGTFVSATDTGTDPNVRDTDHDGYHDGVEVPLGSNPVDVASVPVPPWGSSLLAFWDFNDATDPEKAKDLIHGIDGVLVNGALFTEEMGGHTGNAGDRAMDFGADNAKRLVRVANAAWLNAVTVKDNISVMFWQQLYSSGNGSSFWIVSPSSSSGMRGMQAHVPWGGVIYFDSAGCCGATTQRINKGVAADFDWTAWHHFAFVKRGAQKRIYIDGVLFHEGQNTAPMPNDLTELTLGAQNEGSSQIAGLLDDFALFASALDASQIAYVAHGGSPADFDRDTDHDGMPDIWEDGNGFNKNDPTDAALDTDSDGSTNLIEYRIGTDPRKADTDDDGLKDSVETNTGVWKSATDTGTNPFNSDTDGDLLKDGVESNTGTFVSASDTGTSPLLKDTDSDKFTDAVEISMGSDPTKAASVPLEPGKPNLLGFWDFNDPSVPDKAIDKVRALPANVISNAVYTPDQGGWTAATGDFAIDFGYDGAGEAVIIPAVWLGAVAAYDQISISFHQKLYSIADSACFWAISPSTGNRGFSAHAPWSNNSIYFDTAGCCDGTTQRISSEINTTTFPDYSGDVSWWNDWHHFVFIKNTSTKQIWIDGKLFLQGTNTARLPDDFTELQVGLDVPDGYKSMMGLIDDFAVFASGLAPEQVAELAAGKSPLAIQPLTFSITRVAIAAAGQALDITFESTPATRYTVLQSSDLKIWTTAGQIDGAPGGTTTYSAPVAPAPGGTFYRIQR